MSEWNEDKAKALSDLQRMFNEEKDDSLLTAQRFQDLLDENEILRKRLEDLNKEYEFYKRFYEFSTSKGAPDASPQLNEKK